jgi:hypothetical protein
MREELCLFLVGVDEILEADLQLLLLSSPRLHGTEI